MSYLVVKHYAGISGYLVITRVMACDVLPVAMFIV